jgi:hypothetical protein
MISDSDREGRPRTVTGLRLLADVTPPGRDKSERQELLREVGADIRAIEDEAVAAYKVELAEKVRALPHWALGYQNNVRGDASHGRHAVTAVDRAKLLALIEAPAPSEGGESR